MPSEGQLVMKEGAWKMGNTTSTVLFDKEEEVVATRDTTKENEAFGTSRYGMNSLECYLKLLTFNFTGDLPVLGRDSTAAGLVLGFWQLGMQRIKIVPSCNSNGRVW